MKWLQVSLHCVQAYGHLRDYLAQQNPAAAPPRIMLHSYGGSPDMVHAFTSLGRKPHSSKTTHTKRTSPEHNEQPQAAERVPVDVSKSSSTAQASSESHPVVEESSCGSKDCGDPTRGGKGCDNTRHGTVGELSLIHI